MAKDYYLPRGDIEKNVWLQQFKSALNEHAITLGIVQAILDSVTADAAFFNFTIQGLTAYKEKGKEWTQFKNLVRNGDEDITITIPVAPDLGIPPTLVPPGIFNRIIQLVRDVKNNSNYNTAIGQDMGIIGEEDTTDPATIKPVLGQKFEGNKLYLTWKKGIADAILFYIDKGDGKWNIAGIDKRPDFEVKDQLPGAGQSAVWKFKAIYLTGDMEETGQWSDVISVTVTGTV